MSEEGIFRKCEQVDLYTKTETIPVIMEKTEVKIKPAFRSEEGQDLVRAMAYRLIEEMKFKLENEIPQGYLYGEYSITLDSETLGLVECFCMTIFVDPNLANRRKKYLGISVELKGLKTLDRAAYLCNFENDGLIEYLSLEKNRNEICDIYLQIMEGLCQKQERANRNILN